MRGESEIYQRFPPGEGTPLDHDNVLGWFETVTHRVTWDTLMEMEGLGSEEGIEIVTNLIEWGDLVETEEGIRING